MRLSRFASLACSALVALWLVASSADAGERRQRARGHAPKSGEVERTVTRTRPDGTSRTSTHESTWQRGDGQWTRDTVHTGPGGKQGTTHVRGSYDPATKTWTKDATTTRPDGSTASTQVIRKASPAPSEPAPAE